MNIVTMSDEVFIIGQKKDDDGKPIEGTGKEVKCRLRKLKTKDVAIITPLMADDLPDLDRITALISLEDVFSRCVDIEAGMAIDGALVTVDGVNASAADLSNEVALASLAWGIINKLINISSLSEGDKGN